MQIRPATTADGAGVVELVHYLASFEKLPPPDEAATRRLVADAFCVPPKYQLWVAVQEGEVLAYAAWFLTYSTFRARQTLYLEDLFVHPNARRQGLATRLLEKLQAEARRLGCGRFEWSVLDWNRGALALYESIGARALEGWQTMRIDLEA